jgi:aspartyl protease family protein
MNCKTTSARRWLAAAALVGAFTVTANAQTVAFSGMLGTKALLVINGQAKGVALGATEQGVKLVKIDGTIAQVEVGGKMQSLRLGGVAVVAGDPGGSTSGSRIVLPVGSGGHYAGLGSINGQPMRFVVDTGATSVAMGSDLAAQLGLDPRAGKAVGTMTANGAVAARQITLTSVRVGDVTVYNVEAMVVPQAMPFVLLGNSFLSHFQLHSDSNSLVLDKKN